MVLVGKPEGGRPLERPRLRWESYVTMDFKVIGTWTGLFCLSLGRSGGHGQTC